VLGSEQFLSRLLREQRHRLGPLRFHECASSAELCARQIGAQGPCTTLSTACSAGTLAIAAAAELIEQDEADVVLAGASDSLCRLTLHGFGSLLLLDPNGCRPFDAARAGISLGEGAAVLVLEAQAVARARGAKPLAGVSGWGASCDAYHATAPQPDGDGALIAMQRALDRAGLPPPAIDYVNAHGTGTPDNDAMEATALRRLFGDRVPPFSSTKRFFGHTLAASGALKAVVCVQALQEQAIPPNPGFETVDPRIGLEPVRAFRSQRLAHVLSSSFGFGGSNAALVFSHPDTLAASPPSPRELGLALLSPRRPGHYAVVGLGTVSPAGLSLEEVGAAFRTGGILPSGYELSAPWKAAPVRAYTCRTFAADEAIPPSRRRRLNRLQQMTIAAARRSLTTKRAPAERACVAMGTGLGCLDDASAFGENLVAQNEGSPLPLRFTNSVHNALASQIALELDLKGLNSTVAHRETSFEAALWHATQEIELGHADLALVGAADELNRHAVAAGVRWGWWSVETPEIRPFGYALRGRQRPLPGEGATVFALTEPEPGVEALAIVSAIRFGRWVRTDGSLNATAEADWIQQTLARDGDPLAEVDLLLTGANGWPWLDQKYQEVAEALSRLAGRLIPCGAYKQCCGEHASASAFGLLTAIGLVRGDIPPAWCGAGAAPLQVPCPFTPSLSPSDGERVAKPGEGDSASIMAPMRVHASEVPASLESLRKPRRVVLYTLSPSGGRGLCCISA